MGCAGSAVGTHDVNVNTHSHFGTGPGHHVIALSHRVARPDSDAFTWTEMAVRRVGSTAS